MSFALSELMKIFCIGIGGIGLSAVAKMLASDGHQVSGSDSSQESLDKHFLKSEIQTTNVQTADNIDESFDLVIYSEAVPIENPERQQATQLGIKQINYAEALGMISKNKKTIAVAGTHGKTTTTGMLSSILLSADLDPTIVIGSTINLLDHQNYRVGKSEWFLTEACEYRDNFLTLTPHILLITNLEPDHLDYFKTAERYYQSYQQLIEKIPAEGCLILPETDSHYLDLSRVQAKTILLGEHQSKSPSYALKVPGKHNQKNAFAAETVAQTLGIADESISHGLSQFSGTGRRFEYKGEINGAKLYDDYGHHPTEIRATLQAAREWFPDKHIVLIFQPHQYSRTREFFDEFVASFDQASEVWVTDIYKARDSEEDIRATSAQMLAEASVQVPTSFVSLDQIPRKIHEVADPSKVFLVMGAGNISSVFQALGDLQKG